MKCTVFNEYALSNLFQSVVLMFNYYNEKKLGVLNWFLGGSFRFGYYTENSDLDFFIHAENKCMMNICHFMVMNDFEYMNPDEMVLYPHGTRGYKHLKYNIHIIIFEDYDRWERLRKEHNEIESYLSKNGGILIFIKTMKEIMCDEIKGKWFYRVLLNMVVNKK